MPKLSIASTSSPRSRGPNFARGVLERGLLLGQRELQRDGPVDGRIREEQVAVGRSRHAAGPLDADGVRGYPGRYTYEERPGALYCDPQGPMGVGRFHPDGVRLVVEEQVHPVSSLVVAGHLTVRLAQRPYRSAHDVQVEGDPGLTGLHDAQRLVAVGSREAEAAPQPVRYVSQAVFACGVGGLHDKGRVPELRGQ